MRHCYQCWNCKPCTSVSIFKKQFTRIHTAELLKIWFARSLPLLGSTYKTDWRYQFYFFILIRTVFPGVPLYGAYSNNPYGYNFLPNFLSRDKEDFTVIGQHQNEAGKTLVDLPALHGGVSFNNPSPLRTVYTLLALKWKTNTRLNTPLCFTAKSVSNLRAPIYFCLLQNV